MEAFLRTFLPRLLPVDRTFHVHPFQGKSDLLSKLEDRLRAYATWLPQDWRIVVVVDRDDDDCLALKSRLEQIAGRAHLITKSKARGQSWQIVNRIAIEELEAWYFGDWAAVQSAYQRLPTNIARKKGFRDPDAIAGGTWEAFERILQKHGYFKGGLSKIEVARTLGALIEPSRCESASFASFREGVSAALA